jgi:hypothetical protein
MTCPLGYATIGTQCPVEAQVPFGHVRMVRNSVHSLRFTFMVHCIKVNRVQHTTDDVELIRYACSKSKSADYYTTTLY